MEAFTMALGHVNTASALRPETNALDSFFE
jgi:hypothetical protein